MGGNVDKIADSRMEIDMARLLTLKAAYMCGIALVAAASLAGGWVGGETGELLGEKVYELISD